MDLVTQRLRFFGSEGVGSLLQFLECLALDFWKIEIEPLKFLNQRATSS